MYLLNQEAWGTYTITLDMLTGLKIEWSVDYLVVAVQGAATQRLAIILLH